MDITFDASGLTDLAAMLERARNRPHAERARVLDKAVERVRAEATATAGSYPNGTGALAAAVEVGGTPVYRRVFANVREAYFLEFGSPNTGDPRPWLTGPAQKAADDMLDELGRTGDVW